MTRTPGWVKGRPAKKLRPRPPDTRRRRLIAFALLLATHPTQASDIMSPARCAHAKLHRLPEARDRDQALRDAFADLRRALEETR